MAYKLIKVAKDLNVGLHTVVDTLHERGFSEIEAKPNAVVTDDMFAVLQKEFQKDIAVKKEAEKLARPTLKKETVSLSSLGKAPLAPLPTLPKKKEPAPLPKVEAPEPTPEPTPIEVVSPPAVEPTPEPVPMESTAPVVEEIIPEAAPQKEEPQKEEKPTEEAIPAPAESPSEDELIKAKRELSGLNVKGKIDLKEIKKPTKSTKPHKKEAKKDKPRRDKPKSKKDTKKRPPLKKSAPEIAPRDQTGIHVSPEAAANAPDEDPTVVEGKAAKLRGLKILGKVEIKKQPTSRGGGAKKGKSTQGAGGDAKKRRPRRRTKVNGPITADTIKKSITSSSRDNRRGRGRPAPKRDENRTVSQKEIEDQIKKTMARMGGGSNKNRRQKIRRGKREEMREKQERIETAAREAGEKLQVTEFISASDLASLMDVTPMEVISTCMGLGYFVNLNQRLDAEVIEVVASEFGHEVVFISAEEQVEVAEEEPDDPADLKPRQPIVTVMGHVDHGKTSLLDFIREANVMDGEAGGITQHIGAYEINVHGDNTKKITFLDTPGHEAFTAMRARGAKVTDIAIIVIAADDNIMPQTKEAISHAQAANVPIVFAINKIDKPGADPERIKGELAQMNLLVEDWGGKFQSQDISAKQGTNVQELLEKVILEAELLELKANPDRRASGTVLEASMEKGRGYATKVLIQNGTMKIGDPLLAGEHAGRVKAMFNERNQRVEKAGPAQPVLILGLPGAPQAGEIIRVTPNESEAKEIATKRSQIIREQNNRATRRISLEEIGRRLALGSFKELNLIVKGDVDGSVEALSDSLLKLGIESVQVNVIHKAVGQIIDSDVMLASASDAIIIGFQVRSSLTARKLAEAEGVEIKTYSIIYEAIEEVKAAIEGLLEPTKEEEIVATVEVRETYKISKIGTIAGCYVQEGKINRNNFIRLIRDGIVIYPANEKNTAELGSLKRFKEDAKEVRTGMECGLTIKNFNDIKVGDVVEAYVINEIKQKLPIK